MDKDNVLRDAANGEEDRDTRVRCTRREEGDARRDRSVPARNSYRWVSPRPRPPPTPGEIYLPFRSSILFLHSCYPSSLSSFPHSYALIKFNNFCATRALCVLFALFPPPPSSPLSLSLPGIFRTYSSTGRSLGVFAVPAACLCDSPRSLSRYKLVWRLARALPPSCYHRVPQIYDGNMLDPVKQARSARDFVSERGEVCFARVHRLCCECFSSSSSPISLFGNFRDNKREPSSRFDGRSRVSAI